MPNIKSAKKRVKVTAVKTANNKAYKSALRTTVKKANLAVDTNSADKAEAVRLAMKKIDQRPQRESCTRIPLQERSPHLPASSTPPLKRLFSP